MDGDTSGMNDGGRNGSAPDLATTAEKALVQFSTV